METSPTPGHVVVRPKRQKPRRCAICRQRHAMPRDDVRLAHCEGVLVHRARLVLVVVEREAMAA